MLPGPGGPCTPAPLSWRVPKKGHGAQDMSLTAFFPTGEAAESRDALAKTLYALRRLLFVSHFSSL